LKSWCESKRYRMQMCEQIATVHFLIMSKACTVSLLQRGEQAGIRL
jgi:hypothetical protein